MESWGDRLGTQVDDDATLKPAGQVFRDLATLVRRIHLVDFDPSSGQVTTDRGELVVKLKNADTSAGYSLYHVSGSRCFAAMSQAFAQWSGKQLAAGPPNGYVYIFSDDGSNLMAAPSIYAKSDVPGKLTIYGRSSTPRSVSFVDISPLEVRSLGNAVWSRGAGTVEINVDPTLQAYWVRVEW